MAILTAQVSTNTLSAMTDLITRSFTDAQSNIPQNLYKSGIVVKETMPKGTGEFKRMAERIDRSLYASKRAEWDDSAQAKVQYGYEKDLKVYTVSLQVGITKRMRDAGKNQDILDKITMLSDVCPMTRELDLGLRLSNAWATSYTDKDGVTVDTTVGNGLALISGSHTLTGSATTYSNQITSNPAFSKAALEVGEISFVNNSYDNLGQSVVVNPDTLITTDDPTTVNDVLELFKATANTDSANAGTFNTYRSKYKHVIVPSVRLNVNGGVDTTKSKYWFLASSAKSDFYLCTLNEPYLKTPMDGNNGEDFSSETWNYLAGADYGIAIVSGKWIRGSKGDAS